MPKDMSKTRQNAVNNSRMDGKPAMKTPTPKKGDSRSRSSMKNISPQKPCGKVHG